MYRIEWNPKAVKQVRKIKDHRTQVRIYEAVGELATFPNCSNIKSLVNHDYHYRLRVGDYRVFFDVVDTIRVISIEEVKKRDENTY